MAHDWPTKDNDIALARSVIEQYSQEQETERLGLFELGKDEQSQEIGFRVAPWVINLAWRYLELYGAELGNTITRKVLTHCLVNGESVH